MLEPDTSRPTASFDDPILRWHAYRIHHVGLNGFLMALAAWQRGLKVTFHYEVATKSSRFANAAVQGFRGELLSVSDGTKTHFFRRTLGDLTTRHASALAEDKQATKQRLIEHGIDVPDGIVVRRSDTKGIDAFLARYPSKRFLLKPLNGTLGKGVIRDIAAEDVVEQVKASQREELLLEEFVQGDEYRLNIVSDRFVTAVARLPANVMGDGRLSVRELIEQKNEWRRRHPLYHHSPIGMQEAIGCLALQGVTLDSLPEAGVTVWLGTAPSTHHGGDIQDRTNEVPLNARRTAVMAQKVLGLPTTGMDVIVHSAGTQAERAVVLEANQMPHTGGDSLPLVPNVPSPGNRFSEAIIDHYFPASIDNPRYVKASFDFMQVCQTLRSGTVGEVTLPVLGPDWVHRRFSIAATQVGERTEPTLRNAMFTYGIHAQLIKSDVGDVIVDVIAPEARYNKFVGLLGRR